MDRVFESGAAVSPPAAPVSPSTGYATAGNPSTGTPPTKPGPHWYHMVTEELRALVEAGGLTPDHLTLNQITKAVQAGGYRKATAAGTADAITGSFTPGITALTDGMTLYVRAVSANATATPTFTPASGTIVAKTIVKGAGTALVAGDIAGAGHWLALQYDLTLDKWVLLNPSSSVTTKGVQRFSSNGSFTVPAGVSTIYVSGCAGGGGGGAGGGGGSTTYNGSGGAGGGAGEPTIRTPIAVTPGHVLSVVIGAGGAGGAGSSGATGGNGTNGGDTTLTDSTTATTLLTLLSGSGALGGVVGNGTNAAGPAGAAGYPAGGGGLDGCGAQGLNSGAWARGGTGGSGPFGGGGRGGRAGSSAGVAGTPAHGYGSGGGGGGGLYTAGLSPNGPGGNGSAGRPGILLIEW
jgi:hypothetical protein